MKRVMFVIFVLLTLSALSQEFPKDYCFKLQEIIETPVFNRRIGSFFNQGKDLYLIDTSNVFCQCNIEGTNGEKVPIIDIMPQKERIQDNNYVVISTARRECVWSIIFFSPLSNELLVVHYLIEGDVLTLLGHRYGVY